MHERSLAQLVSVLLARWPLVVPFVVMAAVGGVVWSALLPPEYRSSAVIAFTPGADATPDSSFLRLLPRYSFEATADDTRRAAEEGAGLRSGALAGAVTTSRRTGALELEVRVQAPTAAAAEAAVGVVAATVVSRTRTDPLVDGRLVVGPTAAADAAPTRRAAGSMAMLVVGLVTGLSLALMVEGLDPRIWHRDDLLNLGFPTVTALRRRALVARRRRARHDRAENRLLLMRSRFSESVEPVVVPMSDTVEDAAERIRSLVAAATPGRSSGDPLGPTWLVVPVGARTAEVQAVEASLAARGCVVEAGVLLRH